MYFLSKMSISLVAAINQNRRICNGHYDHLFKNYDIRRIIWKNKNSSHHILDHGVSLESLNHFNHLMIKII
jgi:hypothetical protein